MTSSGSVVRPAPFAVQEPGSPRDTVRQTMVSVLHVLFDASRIPRIVLIVCRKLFLSRIRCRIERVPSWGGNGVIERPMLESPD
jgi:hypothetical protein